MGDIRTIILRTTQINIFTITTGPIFFIIQQLSLFLFLLHKWKRLETMQKMKATRTSRAVVLVFVFAEEKFLEHV